MGTALPYNTAPVSLDDLPSTHIKATGGMLKTLLKNGLGKDDGVKTRLQWKFYLFTHRCNYSKANYLNMISLFRIVPGILSQRAQSSIALCFPYSYLTTCLGEKRNQKKKTIKNTFSYGSFRVQVNYVQVPMTIGLDGLCLSIHSNEACPEAMG